MRKRRLDELGKVNGREYVRLCSLSENTYPCLGAVYTGATLNRLLDVIGHRQTFCPPSSNAFPPPDIVARLSAWLSAHPAFLNQPSRGGLGEALKTCIRAASLIVASTVLIRTPSAGGFCDRPYPF